MKFEIVKELLFKRLADLNSIVDRKTTQPILGHVCLSVEENLLKLTTTDTEVTIAAQAGINGQINGRTTVPCDRFYQIVQRLNDGTTVQCELIDEQFHIRAGKSHFKLSTLPAEDFPVAENVTHQTSIELDGAVFYTILNKVRFSIANQDPRQYLNGLFLNVVDQGQSIHAVATDGHRLSCAQAHFAQPVNPDTHFIVPEKAVNELVKHASLDSYISELQLKKLLCSSVEETNELNDQLEILKEVRKKPESQQAREFSRPVTLYLGERELSLQSGPYHFVTRLIDGQYPAYEQVIPPLQENPILISRERFLLALRRAKVLLTDRHDGIRMRFEYHQLQLAARNMENETAEESLDIVNAADLQMETGLNINYLIDAVSHVDGDDLQFHFEDGESPCLLTSKENPEIRYVIMPMRL